MSIEILKFFIAGIESEKFGGRESLAISNPLTYKYDILESRATLYISKDERDRKYKYIISFFNTEMPYKVLYYFCSETTSINLSFFR